MEITTIQQFIRFYGKTRESTLRTVMAIPPDQLDWTFKPGKFTVGDLVRHIAAIERNLFAELVQGKPNRYAGCGPELAASFDEVLAYLHKTHGESMAIFNTLTDADLNRTVITANGQPTALRNFLRALIIHEIHHRGALCIYLSMLGVSAPPLYGLTAEQLIQSEQTNSADYAN